MGCVPDPVEQSAPDVLPIPRQLRQNDESPAQTLGLTWGNMVGDTRIELVTSTVSRSFRSIADLLVFETPQVSGCR
jgi:hypothetical protein